MRPIFSQSLPSLSRREWLKLLIGLSALLPARWLLAASASAPARPVALPTFLDTLLPGNESPAATTLDLHERIWSQAKRKEEEAKLIWLGCAWLDREAQRVARVDFQSLQEDQRIDLVQRCENSAPRTMPRVFFQAMRDQAFLLYYTDPRSWPALGYDGPPQPRGFAGHNQPLDGAT